MDLPSFIHNQDSADQDDDLDTTWDWHTLSRYSREWSLFTDAVSEVFNGKKYFKGTHLYQYNQEKAHHN